MNADTLIKRVLDEGRKIVDLGQKMDSMIKIGKRSDEYNAARDQGGRDRDFSYGLGRSRNHHLNAVVRHMLPSLGKLLHHTNTARAKGNVDPDLSDKEVAMRGNGMGYMQVAKHFSTKKSAKDPARVVWDEYHRHLRDLADHIDRHSKRMKSKTTIVYNRKFKSPDQHDNTDHRGMGFDTSELGEIMTAHINFGVGGDRNLSMIHPADDKLRLGSKDRLVAMLDRFYRGNKSGLLARTSQEPMNLERLGSPLPDRARSPEASRLVSASKKISIPQGWKAMIARNQRSKR